MADETTTTTTKPGYKTTEFYLSLAATLLSTLFASGVLGSGGTDLAIAGLLASALTAAGYSVSRGNAKKAGS